MSSKRLPASDRDAALLDELLETLKSRALRITRPRVEMLRCLLAAQQPMSIEELRTRAGSRGEPLIFTTVFRFMLELERLKLARRVHVSPSLAHFELSLPHRHRDHLVCHGCGQVTTIEEECPVGELERRIARRYGFTEVTHSLEFFGLCSACTQHSGKSSSRQ
jgi:Fur family transcriptional regulator, ferric uptake regulator